MAAQKKLEPGSKYASFDKDGDGIVTDEEFDLPAYHVANFDNIYIFC